MQKRIRSFSMAIGVVLFLATSCACMDNRPKRSNKQENTQEAEAKNSDNKVALLSADELSKKATGITRAVADIKGYQDSKINGKVTFTKVKEGIQIVADIEGLTPGKHGFHVHEHGDCSGTDGMKAGGHFNPTNTKHGGPDSAERHVGDLGNLVVDSSGHAHYDRVDNLISFSGKNSILNRSIIIHADPDDFVTQPTGASGARVACGIVLIVD